MAAKEGEGNWGKLAAATAPAIIKGLCDDTAGRGRPTVHEQAEHEAEIVTRLCVGESLPMICTSAEMPSLRTVNRWLAADPDFAATVRYAREIGVQALMDAAMDIASGGAKSTGSVERDKLLCSVIRWIVAKRDPENAPRNGSRIVISLNADDLDLC